MFQKLSPFLGSESRERTDPAATSRLRSERGGGRTDDAELKPVADQMIVITGASAEIDRLAVRAAPLPVPL